MQQLSEHRVSEHRVRPRIARILGRVAGALLFTTALCQYDLAHAAGMVEAGASTEAAGSMAADFTPARFTADLADFTVASRVCTMVSASGTRVSAAA